MKILIIGAPRNRPTDGQIHIGINKILDNAFGESERQTVELNDHAPQEIIPKWEPDMIVVAGTPWFWDGMATSHKFKNAVNLFERYPNASKAILGAGSCFPVQQKDFYQMGADLQFINPLEKFFGEALVTCRDLTAMGIVINAIHRWNIKPRYPVKYLPCPAYFSNEDATPPDGGDPVIFYFDPRRGVNSLNWGARNYEQYYKPIFEQFIFTQRKHGAEPKAYAIYDHECESFQSEFDIKCNIIESPTHVHEIIKQASQVISGRVHLAIPSFTGRRPTTLITTDTRANSFHEFSAGFNMESVMRMYVEQLRKHHESRT